MKKRIFDLLAITSVVAFNVGANGPAVADTLTTVTTTTTEAPVETYHYRRVIAPVTLKPYEKSVTIKRSSVIKNASCHTSCTKSNHTISSIHHTHHIASATRPRMIASTSTTKTITRTIEKPVYVDRVVERPVYRDRVVEKPVVVERPVVVRQSYASTAPLMVQEKVTHHSDHDTIKIKQYY